LHILQSLYTYVANVCPQYFICFFRHMLHMFHTYVVSVLFGCCVCFAMDTHVFFQMFRMYVASFWLFQTYVTSVSSRCCKSRSVIAHVIVGPIYSSHLLQLLAHLHARGCREGVTVRRRDTERHRIRCGLSPHVKPAQQPQASRRSGKHRRRKNARMLRLPSSRESSTCGRRKNANTVLVTSSRWRGCVYHNCSLCVWTWSTKCKWN
jgi:hypothetical protein